MAALPANKNSQTFNSYPTESIALPARRACAQARIRSVAREKASSFCPCSPNKGDAQTWKPRLAQGRDVLVRHVPEGVSAMPPCDLCMVQRMTTQQ